MDLHPPHLEEVKESNKRCFSNLLLPIPEEEPASDPGVQQLRVFLGQGGQVEPLLTAVPTAEESLLRFVPPGRPCRTARHRGRRSRGTLPEGRGGARIETKELNSINWCLWRVRYKQKDRMTNLCTGYIIILYIFFNEMNRCYFTFLNPLSSSATSLKRTVYSVFTCYSR